METEYLSIKDFAKRAGVSQQSLYKRLNKLNNQLNNYIKLIDNQKMIDIRALQEVYGVEVEQPIQPFIQPVEQPIQPNFDSILSQNQQMIDMLKEQLEAKDKQIENLQATNNELVKQKNEMEKQHHDEKMELLENLKLAQMLQANAEKKVLQLEESKQEPVDPMQEVVEPDEPPTPPKGFWAKIFKK